MREGMIHVPGLFLTRHATKKFGARAGHTNLKDHEVRRHMRYLLERGEQGTRVNGEGEEQPVIRSEGWIFVISMDLESVVTVFYNESK